MLTEHRFREQSRARRNARFGDRRDPSPHGNGRLSVFAACGITDRDGHHRLPTGELRRLDYDRCLTAQLLPLVHDCDHEPTTDLEGVDADPVL